MTLVEPYRMATDYVRAATHITMSRDPPVIGAISYVRGHIQILDRQKLEGTACECCRVVLAMVGLLNALPDTQLWKRCERDGWWGMGYHFRKLNDAYSQQLS